MTQIKIFQLLVFMLWNCVHNYLVDIAWHYHPFNCLAYYNDWPLFYLAHSYSCLKTITFLMRKWPLILVAITEMVVKRVLGSWLILKMLIYDTEYKGLNCLSLAMQVPPCSPNLKTANHRAIHIHFILWNKSNSV